MLDEYVKELIVIAAAVSASCHQCVSYHITKAREMAVDEGEIQQAIELGMMIRKNADVQMRDLLEELSK